MKLWKIQGQEINTFEGHKGSINSVTFHPSGTRLVSASDDANLQIWDLQGKKKANLSYGNAYGNTARSFAFSPNGKSYASAWADGYIYLQPSLDQKTTYLTLKGHSGSVNSIGFSPDSKILVSGSSDSTVKLWNLQGKELKTLKGHSDSVNSVSFSPDGQIVASGSSDSTVKLWNLQGKELKTLRGHRGTITSVSFTPDGQLLASAGYDGTVRLWNLQGQELRTLKGHNAPVNSVSFSPDGQTIASAGDDATVKLWNLEGQELETFRGHSSQVYSVSFSPDGKMIASAGADQIIKLWNAETLNFDQLVARGCNWVRGYLTYNPDVKESDRHVCDAVGK